MDDHDGFEETFKRIKKVLEERFSVEKSLDQVLWDAQVEDEYIDQLFNAIVTTMQMALKDKNLKREILAIKLREIPDED